MVKEYEVVWDKPARQQLKKLYEYIRKDSFQNAEQVKIDILSKVSGLGINPKKHPADKLRADKNVQYRAFEIHKFRVSFYIDNDSSRVQIIRVRNTKQEPLEY